MSYNPKPTRVWSRVQHPCTFTLDVSYNSVFSPLTGKTTSLFEADYYNKLIYKGNILQYKKNTSNLTKSQRYSQICKGMWTNRTKSYATQTQTYTNPNTSNLKQVNYVNVPTNGVTTYIPGPLIFNIPAPNGCISDSIKDGGSLLCNTIVNPCTDEVIDVTKVLECYPTYCSDVPGPIIDLCWNPKLDTWYPRQNLTMPTSGTKWPEGYKGLVSAVRPDSGVLSLLSLINTNATLNWSIVNNNCIPISSYNIYENGQLIANVPYPTNTYTYTNCDTNTFYITSISGTIESEPSNTITITSPPQQLQPPVLSLDSSTATTATLDWTFVNNDCIPISGFKIYENGLPIEFVSYPTNTATFTICGSNDFYVTSVSGSSESLASNIIPVSGQITPPANLTANKISNNTATLSWIFSTSCNITQFKIYNAFTHALINYVNYPTYTDNVSLILGDNSFYVTAISGGNESVPSNIVNVNVPQPFTTTTGALQYVSGYYIITFTTNGTITFNTTISNVSIICVAGGGGGGNGGNVVSGFEVAGAGGGGGGNYLLSGVTSLNVEYSVTIGLGGIPESGGGYSQVSIGTTSILQCSGGVGGSGTQGTGSGAGGTVTVGGSGGSGGNGGIAGGSVSQSSSSFNTPFTIPSALALYIYPSYSGGGGASGYASNPNGGASGLNGEGGLAFGSSGKIGQIATTPGSGGGGGAPDQGNQYAGGAGAPGIVIFYFQYP